MTRLNLHEELTTFYEKQIERVISDWQHAGMTYRQMSIRISDDTGFRVQPTTLQRWMSFWRNGR